MSCLSLDSLSIPYFTIYQFTLQVLYGFPFLLTFLSRKLSGTLCP
jgi:hypothetical protein